MERNILGLSLVLFLMGCPGGNGDKETGDTEVDPNDCVEEDGDGYCTSEGDCDDNDASINPDAAEICDGLDNNCDGTADEGVTTTFYRDVDTDGFGNAAESTTACEQPEGYVTNGDDCDDAEAKAYPGNSEVCDGIDNDCNGTVDDGVGTTYYADADKDGYGDAAGSAVYCEGTQPEGYVLDNTDCDDSTAAAYPGNTEVCDTIDNNCDGNVDEGVTTTYYADTDGDGFGDASMTTQDCSLPTGFSENPADCDDTDANVNPRATELCNGIDDNCDGTIDEETAADASTWYADADGDGYGDASMTDVECYQPAGYVADNTDCDDARYETNPGAAEYCNGIDDDCDGSTDEDSAVDASTWYADADSDGYGNAASSDVECYQPAGYVADNTDCNDTTNTAYPGATEYCDGIDNDCDGTTDEDDAADATTWYQDADTDGYGNASVTDVECYQPAGYVADNTDCDDGRALTNPGATEYCNGYDDDCDGTTDEDDAADSSTWYADADADGYGNPASTDMACYQPTGYVADNTDCDDGRYETNPGATEYCNTIDDDCDGTIDEDSAADASTWYRDADSDGYGASAYTDVECYQPSGYVADSTDCDDLTATTYPGATEYCNGEDDDCDGTIDEIGGVADGTTYYADDDTDTYGDASDTVSACSVPSGYVENSYDCNDADSSEPVTVDPMGGSASGDGSAGSPYDLLQDAINAADECVVALEGTYREDSIDLGGKSLDVWGVAGWADTEIDPGLSTCNYTNPEDCAPVFIIASGSGATPTIHGFTVTSGTGMGRSSSSTTTCADSDPSHGEDSSCTVTTWEFCGGGAYVNGDDPTFSEMAFIDNDLPDFDQVSTGSWSQTWIYSYGGGICAMDSVTTVEDSWFVDNSADQGGGAYAGGSASLGVSGSWFDDNAATDGAAMAVSGSDSSVSGSVLACNNATTDGGGIYTESSGSSSVYNSVMYENTAGTAASNGSQIYVGSGVTLGVTYSISEGSTSSPLFYAAGTGSLSNSDLWNNGAGGTYSGSWTVGSGVTATGSFAGSIGCDGNPWNDTGTLPM
ncbi:MAG: putative metal-binding motif-containing protein [Deltaproteobacteria bacterium]|nr:putative metal-binding motif-containing protein [Deltaproteobacteria bacterium]